MIAKAAIEHYLFRDQHFFILIHGYIHFKAGNGNLALCLQGAKNSNDYQCEVVYTHTSLNKRSVFSPITFVIS